MKKTVWILRGCSGAGKDFVTSKLTKNSGWVAVSADNYFTDKDGNYNFDATKLGLAHAQCKESFVKALQDPTITNIIVNNTNTQSKEWKFYQDASMFDCDVIFLVVEKRHDADNVHGVPNEVIDRHEERIKGNLKLR
jgi:uridine kinase